jgi:hypothetical protein
MVSYLDNWWHPSKGGIQLEEYYLAYGVKRRTTSAFEQIPKGRPRYSNLEATSASHVSIAVSSRLSLLQSCGSCLHRKVPSQVGDMCELQGSAAVC